MNEWRRAIRTPISYSVPGSNSTLIRQQTNFISFVIISGAFVLFILYAFMPQSSLDKLNDEHGHSHQNLVTCDCTNSHFIYNRTYPITAIETLSDGRLKYRIAAVADLDKNSKSSTEPDIFISYILYGTLIFDPEKQTVEIEWNSKENELHSEFSSGGRGMELSELIVFNGKLYTCDDRTGIIYEVRDSLILPWLILRNGNGFSTHKGFKCEWMAVKDDHLYVGGLGKEWTTPDGEKILNHDPQYVKLISPSGHIEHKDWRLKYIELKKAAGIESPGYLIHESAAWSKLHQQWYFLPRRASKEPYNELMDEKRATNIVLVANEHFDTVNKTANIGPLIKTHGFSSIKIMPLPEEIKIKPAGSEIILAIKSEEDNNIIASYVTVFRLPDGQVLLPETKFSNKHKYEGIEFV